MVRPRAGNFTYSSDEWAQMHASGLALRKSGCTCFGFGGITAKGRLDIPRCKQFIQAVGLPCVLHRAFDELSDPIQGLEDAVSAGFSRILTGYGSMDLRVLRELKKQAGQRIEILPGGGIRSAMPRPTQNLWLSPVAQFGHFGPRTPGSSARRSPSTTGRLAADIKKPAQSGLFKSLQRSYNRV